METQEIIVSVLFTAALWYVGRLIYRGFQAKSACGSNCKCGVDFSAIKPEK
jgi:hypothetical protein